MLSKEAIAAVRDCQVKEIDVPEWGGMVGIRKLSFAEVMDFQNAKDKLADDNANSISLFLVKTLCDESGNRLFGDNEVKLLESRNYDVLLRLAKAVNEHNGLTGETREETEKNSASGPIGDSTSI